MSVERKKERKSVLTMVSIYAWTKTVWEFLEHAEFSSDPAYLPIYSESKTSILNPLYKTIVKQNFLMKFCLSNKGNMQVRFRKYKHGYCIMYTNMYKAYKHVLITKIHT